MFADNIWSLPKVALPTISSTGTHTPAYESIALGNSDIIILVVLSSYSNSKRAPRHSA